MFVAIFEGLSDAIVLGVRKTLDEAMLIPYRTPSTSTRSLPVVRQPVCPLGRLLLRHVAMSSWSTVIVFAQVDAGYHSIPKNSIRGLTP